MTTVALREHPANTCREYRGPKTGKGYPAPRFNGEQVLLHRWVVEQVEGRPLEPGEVVMHRCDNPPCFLYGHLQRATQSDNIRDAMAKGRHRYVAHQGEANGGGGKLTAAQAVEIRRRWRRGAPASHPNSTQALADEFGIGRTMVRKIGNGRAWR
jgi:hypothetical protein